MLRIIITCRRNWRSISIFLSPFLRHQVFCFPERRVIAAGDSNSIGIFVHSWTAAQIDGEIEKNEKNEKNRVLSRNAGCRIAVPSSSSISRRGNSGLQATRERYRMLHNAAPPLPDCNIRHIICHRAAYRKVLGVSGMRSPSCFAFWEQGRQPRFGTPPKFEVTRVDEFKSK